MLTIEVEQHLQLKVHYRWSNIGKISVTTIAGLTGYGANANQVKIQSDEDSLQVVSGNFTVSTGTSTFGGSLLPSQDDTYDLGSSSKQWRDIYTGDLNLNNTKTRNNEVDGTSGSWTIQEGSEDLYLLNRLNGKKYKFKLEEIK